MKIDRFRPKPESPDAMRVIPVLDLKAGLAVGAFAGDRDRYGLLRGTPEGCNPLAWARRFRELLISGGCSEPPALYVADLDAIEGQPPHLELLASLAAQDVSLWVDAGVRLADEVPPLLGQGVETIIVGLETVTGPETLGAIVADAGAGRVCFSLDLKDRRPLGDPRSSWGTEDPLEIARNVIGLGVRKLLVLDLARIGTGHGLGTEPLIASILAEAPEDLELIVGGGISGLDDLARLDREGVHASLVGSALRDGRIGPPELRSLNLRDSSQPQN